MPDLTVSSAIDTLMQASDQAGIRTAAGLGNVNNTADLDKPISTATQSALDLKAGVLTHTETVYVSSVGNDANAGTRGDLPKLTLASAITQASALITAGADGVEVRVLDGGTYTEAAQITIPEQVHVQAPSATFIGSVKIAANATFCVDKHFSPANNTVMAEHEGGSTGAAIYIANISDGRGAAGAFTGSDNVRNVGGGGKNFFVRVGILYVAQDGIGIGDVSSGDAGHIHFLIPDLYLAGNNAIGILGSAQGAGASNIVGYCDHILEVGTPAATVGISVIHASASVKVTVTEIIADTAYSITAGSLYLSCPKITGTQTGTPAQLMLGTADVELGAEVNNISDANATDLTDGGDSTLHYHSADRDRANHTGTQLASTISDFDTEVANNSAVAANTAKVSNATHTGDATGSTALTVAGLRGVPLDSTVATPSDGDILVYRDSGTDWVLEAKPAGGSNPALNDVTDVTITSVADNEVLAYNSGTSTWINQTAAEAGLLTEISEDTTPQLGGALDGQGNVIENFKNGTVTESGTTVTLGTSHYGRIVVFTAATAVAVTVPDTIPAGVTIGWIQDGAGALTFTGSGSMVVNNVDSHTGSAGQYSEGTLTVYATNKALLTGGTA